MENLLIAEGIKKKFTDGSHEQIVLNGVDLEIHAGKLYCIMGASGSGKSTLLYILSALEQADSGKLVYKGQTYSDIDWKNDKKLSDLRKKNFSFIFQFYNLMPVLTVEENILLPAILTNTISNVNKNEMHNILKKLNIFELKDKVTNHLSGGEQQRVSIARAMLSDASIIFADEPTGNLDYENSITVYSFLKKLAMEYNKAIVVVTHDVEMIPYADTVYYLKNGKLQLQNKGAKL